MGVCGLPAHPKGEVMSERKRRQREPSGLCRWRHHDFRTLNSVATLGAAVPVPLIPQLENSAWRS